VLYVPAGTPVAQRSAPAAGEEDSDEDGSEVLPRSDLYRSIDLSLPNQVESSPGHPHGEQLGSVWWDLASDILSDGPLQIGGYPWAWNYDPVESIAGELAAKPGESVQPPDVKDWVMLAEWTVDSDELDLGVVHWVIRRDDLATGRFDHSRASADMVG
jgi:hypothetical protein